VQLIAAAAEFVGGLTFAGLRRFRAVRLLDRHCVACHGIFAPDADSIAVIKRHLESAVGLDRPHRAERVRPSAYQRGLSALLEHCAAAKQRDRRDCENN